MATVGMAQNFVISQRRATEMWNDILGRREEDSMLDFQGSYQILM